MKLIIAFLLQPSNFHSDPSALFKKMKASSPFSAFYKIEHNYLLCSSPERFIRKEGNRIISQPMKGTAARNEDTILDLQNKLKLQTSEKERSENVMIVDLVRNDLSRIAERGSVQVDELFGIYTFPAVHQMVSTASAQLKSEMPFTTIVEAMFPMGSMTGAPKIRAMEIIDQCESFNRSIYAGSIGYISPNGNFDFNVVIRSILYNDKIKSAMIPVGSAITNSSVAEDEYNECLLKAQKLLQIINGDFTKVKE
jgi:para-aminobenzoate synthetase component 1